MVTRKAALLTVAAAAGIAAGTMARRRAARSPAEGRDHGTVRGVTVDRPAEPIYRFWRDLPTLAGALDRPAQVEELDARRSRWTVRGPVGSTVRWTAEIIEDVPDRLLAWRAEGGQVPHEGRVEFLPAPSGRGTEVRVRLSYRLPGGSLGSAATTFTGDEPDQVLRTTLRRVKQLLECGRVVTVDGQPTGRGPVRERITRVLQHKLATGGRP